MIEFIESHQGCRTVTRVGGRGHLLQSLAIRPTLPGTGFWVTMYEDNMPPLRQRHDSFPSKIDKQSLSIRHKKFIQTLVAIARLASYFLNH
jgi:hypothetical protein